MCREKLSEVASRMGNRISVVAEWLYEDKIGSPEAAGTTLGVLTAASWQWIAQGADKQEFSSLRTDVIDAVIGSSCNRVGMQWSDLANYSEAAHEYLEHDDEIMSQNYAAWRLRLICELLFLEVFKKGRENGACIEKLDDALETFAGAFVIIVNEEFENDDDDTFARKVAACFACALFGAFAARDRYTGSFPHPILAKLWYRLFVRIPETRPGVDKEQFSDSVQEFLGKDYSGPDDLKAEFPDIGADGFYKMGLNIVSEAIA